ncbi:MAG: MASE3 domain-containing protein [Sulfuricurvum sp.]
MHEVFKKFNWFDPLGMITPIVLMIVLVGVWLSQGYFFFHVLVELFAVLVGLMIAIIAYFMYKFNRNDFILFLGIGFFWTALLDLFHMLSYNGMNIYTDLATQNPSTTLWICARLLQVGTLLLAPFVHFNTISSRTGFVLVGLIALGAYVGAFMGAFPVMYAATEGLTAAKIASEYIIMIIALIALIVYRSNRGEYHPFMYRMIQLSLLFFIAAEVCFTLYIDLYGFMNFLGHIFKFLSYWMIFSGVVITAFKEPFSLLSRESSAYDAIPVPVIVVDSEGIIRQTNRATSQCSSRDSSELIGQNNHLLLHPPEVSPNECSVCQAISKGDFGTFEVEFSGQYKQYTISPIKTHGVITGTLQICIDITKQRQAEHTIIQKGTLINTIINTAPVRLFWKDNDSVYMGCNNLFAQDAGMKDSSQIVGKRDSDLPWKAQAELYTLDDQQVIQNGIVKINYEEPQERGNEDANWLSTSKVPLRDKINGSIIGVVGAYTDITDIRQTQIKLKESEKFYRTVFASVHEAILILENHIVVDCNALALSLFDIGRAKLIGSNILSLPYEIECKEESFHHYLDLAYQGEYVSIQCSLHLKNLPEEIKIVEFTLSGFAEKDENKLVMLARDITARAEEERTYRMQMRQAQMGEMISMIAHQWRQPLAIINAIISRMRLEVMLSGEEGAFSDNLIKIEEQSAHLSQTISAYRDFFRPDKPKEYFDISVLIHNAMNLIDHTLKNHGIMIETVLRHDSNLLTYRNEILQVLIALLKNSLDAFVENEIINGKILIILDRDADYCILRIRDNAGGIAPEVINKLFTPYFTTKTKNNGTGLGLYMSKMIIQDHCNGFLEVESENTESIFTIKLPFEKDLV